ncbi:MAG: BrnT family toxin [Bdellovibrionota bacterium]
MLDFTWNKRKNNLNKKKHGISFEEAKSCFFDPMHLIIGDPDSSNSEYRLILVGMSSFFKVLVVVHAEEIENEIRIISARKATKNERKEYERVKR